MAYVQQQAPVTSKPDFQQYVGQDADHVVNELKNLGNDELRKPMTS